MERYDEVIEVKKKPKPDGRGVLQSIDDSERTTTKRPASSLPRKSIKSSERAPSDSESSDTGTEENAKLIIEGFDYRQWETLDVPPEIKELYQYIAR